MQQAAQSCSTYRYCTIRYVTDWRKDISVPVGVAIWGLGDGQFHLRLPQPSEKLEHVETAALSPQIASFETEIRKWLREGDLPYARTVLEPLTDEWWAHVRRLLDFSIRVDVPKPIDCVKPEAELEYLFEAAVQPRQPSGQRARRLEGLIRDALGSDLAKRFRSRSGVVGFAHKIVPVLKTLQQDDQWVVIEAINLAGRNAELEADALTSRMLRIKDGPNKDRVRIVAGYVASPNGLNGEAHMVEWMRTKTQVPVFDLVRDSADFGACVREALPTVSVPTSSDLFTAM